MLLILLRVFFGGRWCELIDRSVFLGLLIRRGFFVDLLLDGSWEGLGGSQTLLGLGLGG